VKHFTCGTYTLEREAGDCVDLDDSLYWSSLWQSEHTHMSTTIMTLGISDPDMTAYADGLRASYGTSASTYARRRATDFKSCGDRDGEAVWNHLASMLDVQAPAR
jgi:hypothetical protein